MVTVSEEHFRAMGSDVHLVVVGAADLVGAARARIDVLEQRWSRFLRGSEISRLNAAAGRSMAVSADTRLLVQRAIDAWRMTGGGFDPTLLDALGRAGYERTFEDVAARDDLVVDPDWRRRFWSRPAVTDITVDGTAVTLPEGIGFDPGGIGKGLAADLIAGELLAGGAAGVCVNMGGDLRVAGESPDGGSWVLSIDHPWSDVPLAVVALDAGAVATSTVLRRTWTVGGQRRHHLIDPATGEPSTSDLALASVIAGEAWIAEVLAKAVLLRGHARAFDLLDEATAALIVDHAGGVTTNARFAAFTGGTPVRASVPTDPPGR